MARGLTKGDRVRSLLNPDTRYVVEANRNGWLTVRVADPLNADLVYTKQRASIFVRLEA